MKSCFPILVLPLAGEGIPSAIHADEGLGIQHKSCRHEDRLVHARWHTRWHYHIAIVTGGNEL